MYWVCFEIGTLMSSLENTVTISPGLRSTLFSGSPSMTAFARLKGMSDVVRSSRLIRSTTA